ncbi:MAG: signal peptidase I [Limisphaerales bacterium]
METQSVPPRKQRWRSWIRLLTIGRNPKTTAVRAVVLALVCWAVFKLALAPAWVEGLSMAPTYSTHSFTFVNRLAYLRHEPRRGDVVGIRLARLIQETWSVPHIMYFKRIVGLPGETVSFANGRLFIDGRPLAEPYEKGPCDWNLPPVTLGPDEYFVVGDNRSMPQEEHVFGKAQRRGIVGKALL